MPTTRGAKKRAQAGTPAATPSSKQAKLEDAAVPQPSSSSPPAITEAERKHKSQQIETAEVYEKKDWDEVAKQVKVFRRQPKLGRLLIPFNFNVRKLAAKIPPSLAKKDLAPLANLTRLCFGGLGIQMAGTDPLPTGVQLPQLKIADLGVAECSLEGIASFMPNVQQLHTNMINIHLQPPPATASTSSSAFGHAVCSKLTHLACHSLRVYNPSSREATVAAVVAAFPELCVLCEAPKLIGFPDFFTGPDRDRKGSTIYYTPGERYHIYDYPRHLKKLRAVWHNGQGLWDRYEAGRLDAAACASRPDWGLRSLAGLKELRVLWLTPLNAVDMPLAHQVSELTQLTQFCFTLGRKVITPEVQQLLQSVSQLPQLATLAMPLHLLCTEGCAASPANRKAILDQLAAKPCLKQLLLLNMKTHSQMDWDHAVEEPRRHGPVPNDCQHVLSSAEAVRRMKGATGKKAARITTIDVKRYQDVAGICRSLYDWGHPGWGVFGPADDVFVSFEW